MKAVLEYGRPLVHDPHRVDGVQRVSVDETAFLAATAYHSTSFVTGVVDLTAVGSRGCSTWSTVVAEKRCVSGFPPATTHGRTHLAAAVDRARARRRRSTDRSNLDHRPRPMPPLRLPQPLRRRQHLHRWLVHCADSTIPELHRLARATATSPTTGSPYCCTAASSGTLPTGTDQRPVTMIGRVEIPSKSTASSPRRAVQAPAAAPHR